jgi:hypothetical protein
MVVLSVSRNVIPISVSMIEKTFTKQNGQYPGCLIEEYIKKYNVQSKTNN